MKMVVVNGKVSERAKLNSFQKRVRLWLISCFGRGFGDPDQERAARLMEESLELFHAQGKSFDELIALAKRVYSRPAGDVGKELGDVMVTLAALAEVTGHDMGKVGEEALVRNWDRIDVIREKQASKPKGTVLPGKIEPENNWEPTPAQTASACMSYRHDFGLLDSKERTMVSLDAKEWLRAWLREMPRTPALRHVKAPVGSVE
jgi:NTP pyrophosphatase (non-canonical NTP hydrolase)